MNESHPDREPMPHLGGMRALVFSKGAPVWRWQAGLRAALAVAIPGTVLVATGHAHAALFVTFGAFAVLYGEGRPYRIRAQVVGSAAAALLLAVAAGAAIGNAVGPGTATSHAAAVLLVTVPAVLAVYTIDALRLGPPGALFFGLVGGGALLSAEGGVSATAILGAACLGALTAIAVSMSGALVDFSRPQREAVSRAVGAVRAYAASDGPRSAGQRQSASSALVAAWATVDDARSAARPADSELIAALHDAEHAFARTATEPGDVGDPDTDPVREITTAALRPSVADRLRRSVSPNSHAALTALRVAIACLAAGGASIALGLERPHWASISALVVLQAGSDRIQGAVRGLHRFLGTAVGLLLFAALHALSPTGYALIAIVAGLQFCIEILIVRNYALACIFITPIALMAGGAGAVGSSADGVIRDRMVETVIGVLVALLAMYFVVPRGHRNTLLWTEDRVRSAARMLIEQAAAQANSRAAHEAALRLHFELEGTARAGADAAHNDREWTAERWSAHVALVHDGNDLAVAFWSTAAGKPLADQAGWRARFQ